MFALFGDGFDPIFLLIFVSLIASAVFRYVFFRFGLQGNSLVVQGGFINKYRRVIPFERIQSVEMVQKLRHRIAGVVELRIEVIGSSQTEAALVALEPAEAERLRSTLLSRDQAVEAEAPAATPLVSLTPTDLLVAGVTGGRIPVFVLLIGYFFQVLPERVVANFTERAATTATSWIAITIVLVLGLAVVLVLSLITTILVYWNFTVFREEERLVVTRGLLEQRRSTVPLRRVQAVHLDQNPIRRLLGFASLSVVVAGFTGTEEEKRETNVLLPIAKTSAALSLLGTLLTQAPPDLSTLRRAPRRALVRSLIPGFIIAAAGAALGAAVDGRFALLGAVPGLLLLGLDSLSYRARAFGVADSVVLVRGGRWTRRVTIIPMGNVQHLLFTAGPIQQAFRLSSLIFCIAGGRPRANDLDLTQGAERFAALGARL